MKIAILGATSQIAKDLVLSFAASSEQELTLFARRPETVRDWLAECKLGGRYVASDFSAFNADQAFDVILNFVGVGNPAQAAAMGAAIFDITLQYDELALSYIKQHPTCRYIFLSSGAAYGASFDSPVGANTKASVAINDLQPQDWYAVAKLHAECRHRSLQHLPIIDIRIFNYFSHTQDISARFLITDIARAIRDQSILKTSSSNIVRDFIHPQDFYNFVNSIIASPLQNASLDCYSKAPISKIELLAALEKRFSLRYKVTDYPIAINATGIKPHYYSLNRAAEKFGYIPSFTSLQGITKELEKSFY